MKKYLFGIAILFIASSALAVTVAEDTVLLYENGKKINDNSVLITYEDWSYPQICKNGTCNFMQRFTLSGDYTFIKTSNPAIQDYNEWITSSSAPEANMKSYRNYLQNLADTAVYKKTINLPPPSDSKVYGGDSYSTRGTVGSPRKFTVDIMTGKVTERQVYLPNQLSGLSSSTLYLLLFTLLLVVVGIAYLIRRTTKSRKGINKDNLPYNDSTPPR